MALTTKHRSAIFQALAPTVGEEAIDAMLAEFPATEHDELVTRHYLRASVAELRVEIESVRTEIESVRTEIESVRTEIESVRTEIHRSARQLMLVNSTTLLAGLGLAFGIGRAFG